MAGSSLTKDEALAALQKMLTIRRAEEQVIHFANDFDDLLTGHYHVYIGQEATGVGVCSNLNPHDYIFTTHRNHGHVIARGGELGPVLAEVIGRTTGYNKGRGGTFHVIAPHLGILQTSGIVGGCMPLAAGAAFSAKTRGTDQVSVAFFGDGVLEEGAFYETINLASLWKLPVVFVCENNGAPKEKRKGGEIASSSLAAKQLVDIAKAFCIPTVVVDGADVAAVDAVARDAIGRVRRGEGPFFIEARITRWPGNHGSYPELIGGEFDIAWIFEPNKAPEKLIDWVSNSDPVSLFVRNLVEGNVISKAALAEMDKDIRTRAESAAKFALGSPAPKAENATDHVFA